MQPGDMVRFVRTGGADPIDATVQAVNADCSLDLQPVDGVIRGVMLLDEAPTDSRAAWYCVPAGG